ncbi:hypothetical protein AX17_006463 [Amanita inopinata Kibby_2008]|nr:hypothetical protein AX17_006463 [Amanita inopinata Kibby_2008]
MVSTTDYRIPALPQTQALSSNTFCPPPMDGSLTLPELLDWHFRNSPNHRLLVYPTESGVRTICWREAVKAIFTGVRIVRKRLAWKPEDDAVVAILATSEAVSYFTMNMAVMRAGYALFPISPRNSPAAIAHLIDAVGVKHILLGREPAMRNLAAEVVKILKTEYPSTQEPGFSPLPIFEELFLDDGIDSEPLPFGRKGPNDTILYFHSSGSTSFPKPVPWTHFRLFQVAILPYLGAVDLTDKVISLHSMPIFHAMGVMFTNLSATCGLVIAAFQPRCPPQLPTPDGIIAAAIATRADYVMTVPAIIEVWAKKPKYVKWLAMCDGLLFGGSTLGTATGNYLVSQGVTIRSLYGTSEAGALCYLLPASTECEWEYFKFPANVRPRMIPYGDGTFELAVLSNPYRDLQIVNTKVDGVNAYATSDLFVPHPTKPGYWKVYGRVDDQIMHSTGEKTNPVPLESMLDQDPHVLSSVMFGRGDFQAGVIVDPKPQYKFDPEDEAALADFRNVIWPTIQKMNDFAPQHSRLFKEMIIVSKPSKPFKYTAKNTPFRHAVVRDYAEEIENLYNRLKETTQAAIPPPMEWNMASVTVFARAVINKVLMRTVQDDQDIFEHGCDSLQATWIRNTLLRALHDSLSLDTRTWTENFVYDHPCIRLLASHLVRLASGNGEALVSDGKKVEIMKNLKAKYSVRFPRHRQLTTNGKKAKGDVVLLTGTTGGFGSYLLAQLVSDPQVTCIYAFNRASVGVRVPLRSRQRRALLVNNLDAETVLASRKVVFVEGELARPHFGVSETLYNEMLSSVTHIIHNAWPVHFNLSLSSFEPCIKGVRALIDFALSSPLSRPPRLLYASSIGILARAAHSYDGRCLEIPIDAELAIGMGYTESKWVSEQILLAAAAETPLEPLIVRLGQLCGGEMGNWNVKEWLPSVIQSSEVLGCLPTTDKKVSFLPSDMGAAAFADFRHANLTTNIVHLVHPRPVPWSRLAAAFSEELEVPMVTFEEWYSRLEKLACSQWETGDVEQQKKVPALRLLDFFKSFGNGSSRDVMGAVMGRVSMDQALAYSPTLAKCSWRQLDEYDVRKWISYWRQMGHLSVR